MNTRANQNQKKMYAVAIRDNQDLLLFLSVCRGVRGDVYVNFLPAHEPKCKPHSSYHATGQHHQKSSGHKALVRNKQKINKNFRGSENVVTTGIACDELRTTNAVQMTGFQDVFEIPVSELRPEKYRTFISVDITDTNGKPIITPGAKIIRQAVFQDAFPWIIVTLFDSGPVK